MKPEEAILWIEDTKYIYENMNPDIELSKLKCEAFNLAIQALEKQVPKVPERLNAFRSIGKCGGCERVISARTASVYCQYCGNKVDWGN